MFRLLIVLSVVLISLSCHHIPSTTVENQEKIQLPRWEASHISFAVFPARSVPYADLYISTYLAANSWNTTSVSPKIKTYPRQLVPGTIFVAEDGVNGIYFLEDFWPLDPTMIGYTYTTVIDGALTEADIILNGVDFRWSTEPNLFEMDFESILIHELGHALGVQHTVVRDAVMFNAIYPGNMSRDLHLEDLALLAALYEK